MSSSDIEAPEPSREERELQQIQLRQIRGQEAEQQALRPFQLEAMGLVQESTPELDAKIAELKGAAFKVGGDSFEGRAILTELRGLESQRLGAIRRLTDEERSASLTPSGTRRADIQKLQEERQLKALKGDLPVSPQFTQAKEEQFNKLKESLARRGIEVTGNTIEDASSTSTPGIRAIENFRQSFLIVEDAQRRGELSSGLSGLLATGGFLADVKQRNLQNLIRFPQQRASGIVGQAGVAQQGGQFTRSLQFGANQQNAANQAQFTSDIFGLGGAALGGGLAQGGFLRS